MSPADALRAEIDTEIEHLRAELIRCEDSGCSDSECLLIRRQIRDRQFERSMIPTQGHV